MKREQWAPGSIVATSPKLDFMRQYVLTRLMSLQGIAVEQKLGEQLALEARAAWNKLAEIAEEPEQ